MSHVTFYGLGDPPLIGIQSNVLFSGSRHISPYYARRNVRSPTYYFLVATVCRITRTYYMHHTGFFFARGTCRGAATDRDIMMLELRCLNVELPFGIPSGWCSSIHQIHPNPPCDPTKAHRTSIAVTKPPCLSFFHSHTL